MTGARPQFAPCPADNAGSKARSPLAHLLHALNQPLTGLQCSLELAVAGSRPTDQYIRTLREGLELTGRMRILVQATRELADFQRPDAEKPESFLLEPLLRDTVDELQPVAETKGVLLSLSGGTRLPVRAGRDRMAIVMFRFLESVLSLSRERTEMRIVVSRERERACLTVSWNQGPPPEHSPFSPPELGLLIAQAGWEQAGATWTLTQREAARTCTIGLPLDSPLALGNGADAEK